jgi:ABC-type amino acid transport substrate-binding protein
MKTSILSVLVLATLGVASVAGCGTSPGSNTSNAGPSNANAVAKPKTSALAIDAKVDTNASPASDKVVIAVDNTYPPMEYMNPNDPSKLIGFDVDLGDALSQYLHKDIVWKPTQWDGILPGLTSKKYDMILSSMNDTAERRQKIDFVDYMSFGQVIIVKSGNKGNVQAMSDLKGKSVGVQIATTSDDALKQMGGVTVKEYNTFPEAFQDLANNRLDAVVVDEVVGRYYLNLQPSKYQMAGQPFSSEPVGIGIRKDETQLEKDINDAITKMKSDGTYDKIYSYWFGAK